MARIIFATGNQNKMYEIREIMKGFQINGQDVEILSMKEAGIETDIVEDGRDFQENACIKARAIAGLAPADFVMADDSGLVIDALNGEPGIYSARYLGEDVSYRIKNADLIRRLEGVPDEKRTARFVCAIALITPSGELFTTQGIMEGRIGYEERGSNGFGYDPILLVPPYLQTSAELTDAEKNAISHRGQALRSMRELVERYREVLER